MDEKKPKRYILSEGNFIPSDESTREKKKKPDQKSFRGLQLASDLGFAIAIPLAGGALVGAYLDRRFHTKPIITLSLIFLGLILSFITIFKIVKRQEL